jgi:hypothetical protein
MSGNSRLGDIVVWLALATGALRALTHGRPDRRRG